MAKHNLHKEKLELAGVFFRRRISYFFLAAGAGTWFLVLFQLLAAFSVNKQEGHSGILQIKPVSFHSHKETVQQRRAQELYLSGAESLSSLSVSDPGKFATHSISFYRERVFWLLQRMISSFLGAIQDNEGLAEGEDLPPGGESSMDSKVFSEAIHQHVPVSGSLRGRRYAGEENWISLTEQTAVENAAGIGGSSASCEGRHVYMHDLPPSFNSELLKSCEKLSVWTNMCPHVANAGLGQPIRDEGDGIFTGKGWFATHQFIAEVIFHERIKHYECLTTDPGKAVAYYVPFYAGLEMSRNVGERDLKVRDMAGRELIDMLEGRAEWRGMGGRDHFMVLGRVAWDFLREKESPDAWGNNLLLLPGIQNMSILSVEAHPWHPNEHGIPYPSYFHPSMASQVAKWQKRMRNRARKSLFCFAGAPRPQLEKASIRHHILQQCSASAHCSMLRCPQGPSECHKPAQVMSLFRNSVFCLQPQGDSFTRRSVFDSMLAGCIPVFFINHTAYTQYRWHLPSDENRYSVLIPEERVGAGLSIESQLLSISSDKVEKLRDEVIELIPSLLYGDPSKPLEDMKDAVDVAIEGVIKKIKSLRSEGNMEKRVENVVQRKKSRKRKMIQKHD